VNLFIFAGGARQDEAYGIDPAAPLAKDHPSLEIVPPSTRMSRGRS
jgi:hypothetical protein